MTLCILHRFTQLRRPAFAICIAIAPLLLAGCASRDPLSFIPIGLRTTLASEDKASQPARTVTVDSMLAKARGAKSGDEQASGVQAVGMPTAPSMPVPSAPAPSAPVKSMPPPATDVTVRFPASSMALDPAERLRLQIALPRLLKTEDAAAGLQINLGPAQGGGPESLTLVMQRGATLRALWQEIAKRPATLRFDPGLTPDTARLVPLDVSQAAPVQP